MSRSFTALVIAAIAAAPAAAGDVPPPGWKVAFIGDQGLGADAESVLALILDEGADMVIHAGDFDYDDDPAAWEAQINAVLGPDFPYFACIGNHDENEFYAAGGYQDLLEARMGRLGVTWEGDLGVRSSLRHEGLFLVLTDPGIFQALDPGGVAAGYIDAQLAADDSAWRISAWHKNMRLMQAGDKSDETGWGVYEASRRGGAIIATGHEHSYSRTHLLSGCASRTVADTSDTLVLAPDDASTPDDEGRSFVFVSGLGGSSIRDQELDGAWWASIYTSDQGADYGALFGTFHYQGDPCLAHFYFKDVSGAVADEFLVRSTCGPCAADGPPGPPPAGTASARIVWRRQQAGANEMWLVGGTQVLAGSGALPAKGAGWTLAAVADFDGDGSADMLWRHKSASETTIWLMDGAEHVSSGALPALGRQWRVAGVEDFDGDGRSDILWRRSTGGANVIWYMDGAAVRPESGALPALAVPWSVAATGDFDADGSGDIFWRKPGSGSNMIWLMHGTAAPPVSADVGARPAAWKVAGAADFDGDGATDILWRRPAAGANEIWYMDGAAVRPESGALPAMPAAWTVAGTADFDDDGFADVLWRRPAQGSNLIWFMQGTSRAPPAAPLDPRDRAWSALAAD
jgi:hypothetical protein